MPSHLPSSIIDDRQGTDDLSGIDDLSGTDDLSEAGIDRLMRKASDDRNKALLTAMAAVSLAAVACAVFFREHGLFDLLAAGGLVAVILTIHFSEKSRRKALRTAEIGWKQTRRKWKASLAHAEETAAAADRTSRARSEFLAHMSHEIRTPLHGIIGMARMLLGAELDSRQREYAETVRNRAEDLLQTITDILDFSKIEAGKMVLEVIPFDLRVTMEDIIAMFSLPLSEKQVALTCGIDPEIPSRIKGDPGRLRQVLINLIGNAVKFTEQGNISVTIARQAVNDPEDGSRITLLFSVADTGIGIAGDHLASLFDPYEQAETSITRKYGGTGLGLSIAKQLVERMGGTIEVESAPSAGTTFRFTAVFEKQAPHESRILEMASDIKGVAVLVVDENRSNRRMLKELLQHWGCRHDEAADGATAIAKLREAASFERPFRIVILDAEISGTSGETLGAAMMQEPLFCAPRLIMMTSTGRRGDVARLERAGFAAYLAKPVQQCRLLECLLTVHGNQFRAASPSTNKLVTRHTLAENRRRRLKILLVEDDAVSRKITTDLLERMGFFPDSADNGQMALALLKQHPYDLILMDCLMPVMNGFEATRKIRGMDAFKQTPIIAMTAHSDSEITDKCHRYGMNGCISKPVNLQHMADVIARWTSSPGTLSPDSLELLELPPDPVPLRMIFDKAALIHRVMGDEGFAKELAIQFLKDLPRRRTLLKAADDCRDAEAVRLEAHSLKGAATNLSAPALGEISSRIETAAAEGKMETAHFLLRELDSQIQHFKNALILSKLISLDEC